MQMRFFFLMQIVQLSKQTAHLRTAFNIKFRGKFTSAALTIEN